MDKIVDVAKGKSTMKWDKFGEQLRYYRKQKQLTQKELAEALEISVNTISRLEVGSIGCSIEMLLALCNVLEVSPDALLAGNFSMYYSPYYERLSQVKDQLQDQLQNSIQEFFSKMPEQRD